MAPRFPPACPGFYWTAAALLQPIGSWLHHLSPLRGSRLIFHPVCCQLPRGSPPPHAFFHFICQNLCHAATLSCPSHLGNTRRHCVSFCMSLLTLACFRGELYSSGVRGRNNKQRMSHVNTLVSVTPPDSLQLTPLT